MKPNKKVRLYVNGERQKDIYLNKTKWQIFKVKTKKFLKRLFWTLVIIFAVWGIYKIGSLKEPQIVEVKVEVIPETPILDRIAKCESGGLHFGKNGQVMMNVNQNGSIDIGVMQINNKAWSVKATELGFNLTDEKDNRAMAKWIYENRGTQDWYSSAKCWMK